MIDLPSEASIDDLDQGEAKERLHRSADAFADSCLLKESAIQEYERRRLAAEIVCTADCTGLLCERSRQVEPLCRHLPDILWHFLEVCDLKEYLMNLRVADKGSDLVFKGFEEVCEALYRRGSCRSVVHREEADGYRLAQVQRDRPDAVVVFGCI